MAGCAWPRLRLWLRLWLRLRLQTYLPDTTRTQLDLLHYASYLMSVRRAGGEPHNRTGTGPLVGTSLMFAADGVGLGDGKLWAPYTWELGPPRVQVRGKPSEPWCHLWLYGGLAEL